MKVGIVGAGISGLAVAIRRAARGDAVTVFEKNDRPGGKMGTLQVGGYRFDTGPSLFTLPEMIDELFTLAGRKVGDYLEYEPVENCCRYFYPDGGRFDFFRDRDKLRREIETRTIENPDAVTKRLDRARRQYELGAPVFLFSDFHDLRNFNSPPYREAARHLGELDFYRTMHRANAADFADEKFVRLFDRYATYNGSSPYRAPATLNMIAHLENNVGAYFPRQGIYSIARSLYRLACEIGVEFRFGTQAERILVNGKKARAIVARQEEIPFDCIVSAVDARYAAQRLWPGNPRRKRLERAELSSSAIIFYWGVERRYECLDLHNILFSDDYRREFTDIFDRKTVPDDPTVYIYVSSKSATADAPPGCENWFVMINAPADCGQRWERLVPQTRARVIDKINLLLDTDIEKHIACETAASPPTIQRDTNSAGGAIYGSSSNSVWAAFLRHPNHLRSAANLYFVGGSVHPGGGIPLCLASARIVDEKINSQP